MRAFGAYCAATSTAGSALPSRRGGVHSTISGQPASWAGIASISAVDGSGALPAGTYSPTGLIGRRMRSQSTPGAVSSPYGCGMPARWKASIRDAASSIAARKPGASDASAARTSSGPTSNASRRTPS